MWLGPVSLAIVVVFALGVGVSSAMGLEAPVFGAPMMTQNPGASRDVAVADFNEDGYDDTVTAIMNTEAVPAGAALSLGGSDPALSAPSMLDLGGATWSIVTADFDGDGHWDIAASLSDGAGVGIVFGHGDGSFSEPAVYSTTAKVRGLALVDLSADGWVAVVGVEPDYPGVVVLAGDGSGFSVTEHEIADAGSADEIAVGGLMGDELPDLALADSFNARILIAENTGAGFATPVELLTGDQPRDVIVADFNGDGHDDIVASSSVASDVEVFLADGTGAFATPLVISVGEDARTGAMVARDLDGDADVDLLVVNVTFGTLVALENDGSGQLKVIESLVVASGPTAIAMGNPNGDDVADIIVADFSGASVWVIPSPQTSAGKLYKWPVPIPNAHEIVQVAGATRYETAIEASKLAFPSGTDHLVVASGENWPDAVTASALAGRLHAALLLTTRDALPSAVADEVWRLGVGDAIVIGGEAAVSETVVTSLKSLVGTGTVRRIAGADRYETSYAVAREVITLAGDGFDGRAFVATGQMFADALAVSPLASASGSPVILTPPPGRAGLKDTLVGYGITNIIILGGPNAVSQVVESDLASTFGADRISRIAGADRYATAAEVAAFGVITDGLSWDGVGLATGIDFPDALAGGTLLGSRGSVMLLTDPQSLAPAASAALRQHASEVRTLLILGSEDAIGAVAREAASSALE